MESRTLPLSSREFLEIVLQASYINPFSDEYLAQQRRIAGCDASIPYEEQVRLTVERWNEQLVASVGEIGITGTAGAVANAVWLATGIRVRKFPIALDRLIEPHS